MLFCKDCKFAERAWFQSAFGLDPCTWADCEHPAAYHTEPPHVVSGKPRSGQQYCAVMRLERQPCGPEAKLFEPRKKG